MREKTVRRENKNTFAGVTILFVLCTLLVVAFELPSIVPVRAEVTAEEQALMIGVFPRRSVKINYSYFAPLARHLSRELGQPVKLQTAPNFKEFWKRVNERRYDLVHYNQYHYVNSHKTLGYEVIAMNEEFGKSTIAGAIDIRTDSKVRTVEDLKGKTIVFGGGQMAMMSYIVPTYLLRQAGLKEGDYKQDFARNPPNAFFATYYRQSDAAGVGDSVSQLPVVTDACDTRKMRHLLVSDPLAQLPWAVKGDMPVKLKKQIQQVLVSLKKTEQGRLILSNAKLTGIIKATDKDYDPHRKIIFYVKKEQY